MISVIIPVRNAVNTVQASIKSVLSQGVQDLEVLCIINGTTDDSEKEISVIDDKRVKILHSAPGIVPALNAGLRTACGDIIARQDADDIWLENKLRKQIDYLQANKEVDILGTQLEVVDGEGNFLRNTSYPERHEDIIKNLLSGVNPIGHPSVVFRRNILDKCAGYYDLFPLAEDLDLWMRSIPWFKLANLPETLVRYKHVPNPAYQPQVPQVLASWYRMIYGVK